MLSSYKDLVVWQKAMTLAVEIYRITGEFPVEEKYGLVSQMRRAAVSIPSNIAEGRHRGTRKDFRQFLIIAFASGTELETQIEIVRRLPWGQKIDFDLTASVLEEVMKMLNTMSSKLREAKS